MFDEVNASKTPNVPRDKASSRAEITWMIIR